ATAILYHTTANMNAFASTGISGSAQGLLWNANAVTTNDVYYNNILYSSGSTTYSGATGGNDKNSVFGNYNFKIQMSKYVALIYDGTNNCYFPVRLESKRKDNKSRYFFYFENLTSGFMLSDYWYGYGSTWNGWDTANDYLSYNSTFGKLGYDSSHINVTSSDNFSSSRSWKNKLRINPSTFVGDTTNYYSTVSSITMHGYINGAGPGNAYDNGDIINDQSRIYVINYKALLDLIPSGTGVSNVSNYKEGGLSDYFYNLDRATFDPNISFLTCNDDRISDGLSVISNNMKSAVSSIGSASIGSADNGYYQTLRNYLETRGSAPYVATPTGYTNAGWSETLRMSTLGNMSSPNTAGVDETLFVAFKAKYAEAVNVMKAIYKGNGSASYSYYNNGYVNGSVANTKGTELLAAFNNLVPDGIHPPTVSGKKYLNKTDTVTVTDVEGGATLTFVVTYNDSTTYSGSVSDGGPIDIFHNYTDKTSATLVVTAVKNNKTAYSDTATYYFVKAPSFTSDSSGNTVVTDGVYPTYVSEIINDAVVYAKSNTSFADATSQLQYSYNGSQWFNYTNTGIFVFDNANCPAVTRIYLQEVITKNSVETYSDIAVYTVIKENTFAVYTNNVKGISYYDSSSTISIEDTSHYTDSISFKIKKADGTYIKDGGEDKIFTYSRSTGIKLSGVGAIEDAETILNETKITVEAYSISAEASGYTNKVTKTLYNVKNYSDLIYHESFNGTSNGTTYTTNDAKGVNIIAGDTNSAGTSITVQGLAGDKQGFAKSETGTSADMRKNVLKISGKNQHTNNGGKEAFAKLSTNPLAANSLAKMIAKDNGITISFWRAMQSGTNTKSDVPSGTLKRDAIAFRRQNPQDERDYFMIELTGNMSYAETPTDYFDIVPGEYDVTQNSLSKYSGYWQHIAVTINPKAASVEEAITVYIDGVPHPASTSYTQNYDIPTALDASGGAYAAASDTVEKTIGDLIDMMTDSSVDLCLAHDNQWQDYTDDIYLDDIRIYTDVLTQQDIW
ncbi:MAG: hypothetical protein IJ927_01565, partial [Eubacterium sp.]|nr:hypothetical protein [Eubacterium sp.]